MNEGNRDEKLLNHLICQMLEWVSTGSNAFSFMDMLEKKQAISVLTFASREGL
jgi:hypothetical protein